MVHFFIKFTALASVFLGTWVSGTESELSKPNIDLYINRTSTQYYEHFLQIFSKPEIFDASIPDSITASTNSTLNKILHSNPIGSQLLKTTNNSIIVSTFKTWLHQKALGPELRQKIYSETEAYVQEIRSTKNHPSNDEFKQNLMKRLSSTCMGHFKEKKQSLETALVYAYQSKMDILISKNEESPSSSSSSSSVGSFSPGTDLITTPTSSVAKTPRHRLAKRSFLAILKYRMGMNLFSSGTIVTIASAIAFAFISSLSVTTLFLAVPLITGIFGVVVAISGLYVAVRTLDQW